MSAAHHATGASTATAMIVSGIAVAVVAVILFIIRDRRAAIVRSATRAAKRAARKRGKS